MGQQARSAEEIAGLQTYEVTGSRCTMSLHATKARDEGRTKHIATLARCMTILASKLIRFYPALELECKGMD